MMNAALVPWVLAISGEVLPLLLLAGAVGLFVSVWRWREMSAPRWIHLHRSARRRPRSNVSAINRSFESIPDCPMCNVPMVKRIARHGPRGGTQFWGCSNFPMCRCTKNSGQ